MNTTNKNQEIVGRFGNKTIVRDHGLLFEIPDEKEVGMVKIQ